MSLADAIWLLPVLAGVAIALFLPSRLLALMLGLVLLIVAVFLLGYSLGNYESCESGQPCATGERALEVVIPVAFLGGSALFVAGITRYLWSWWGAWQSWRRRQA
jgi:hypothetical protein